MQREHGLRAILLDCAAWEDGSGALLNPFRASVSTNQKRTKKFTPKRLSMDMVKEMEILQSPGNTLDAQEATEYRALAARANYLPLGKPDTAYVTNERCIYFASPTRGSWIRPKHVVRYLVHHRR